MIVNDKNIEVILKSCHCDNADLDPYEVTDPTLTPNYPKEGLPII